MKKCKILALVLAVALLLSGCSFSEWLDEVSDRFYHTLESLSQEAIADDETDDPAAEPPEALDNEEGDHPSEVDFRAIAYKRPDAESFVALVAECEELLAGRNRSAALDKCRAAMKAYHNFYDMFSYAYIQYCMDMSDAKWQEEYAWCSANSSTMAQAIARYNEAYAASSIPGLGAARYEGHFIASDSDLHMTEALAALFAQEAELENQYYDLLSANTSSRQQFLDDYNEEIANLYIELIRLRKIIAEEAGYESYELLANHCFHGQDYTKEELSAYIDGVKKYVSPVLSLWYHYADEALYKKTSTQKDCEAFLSSAAAGMGGSVQNAWDYMTKYHLYDIAPSETKYTGSFETYLEGFDIPFLFMSPNEDPMDLLTFAHEFGHFFNDYEAHGSNATTNVSEFYSQAMEYLSLCYATEPDAGLIDRLRREKMADSLQVYVAQTVIYHFEQLAYELPEEKLTAEELNLLYGNVAREFNFQVFDWDPREWIIVTHLFEQPFYTISYALSNDAAIQIYQMELETPGSGLAMYCKLAKRWKSQPFQAFVEQSGLEQPLSEERLRSVARLMRDAITAPPEE